MKLKTFFLASALFFYGCGTLPPAPPEIEVVPAECLGDQHFVDRMTGLCFLKTTSGAVAGPVPCSSDVMARVKFCLKYW